MIGRIRHQLQAAVFVARIMRRREERGFGKPTLRERYEIWRDHCRDEAPTFLMVFGKPIYWPGKDAAR